MTYTNTADTPVSIHLAAQAPDTADGLFTVSAPRLTVPAHGTASVTVTAHYDQVPADRELAGFLTATGPTGTVLTRTSSAPPRRARGTG